MPPVSSFRTSIYSHTDFDMSKFVEMVKLMVLKMAEAFGGDSLKTSASEKVDKELKDIEMDVSIKENIRFNYGTGWPTKVVQTGNMVMRNPQQNETKDITVTMVFSKK